MASIADSIPDLEPPSDTHSSPPQSEEVFTPDHRSGSPSPSVTPSFALDAVPLYHRSVSTPSETSTSALSVRSRPSRTSDGSATVVKRRGYVRPQGTSFADSARNRDSVMNLGTISHIQYYFSRTGLLDGKGGQLAREKEQRRLLSYNKENQDPYPMTSDEMAMLSLFSFDANSNYAISETGHDFSIVDSPITDTHDAVFPWGDSGEPPMIPPTVSTYKQKPTYVESPPDMPVLRRELKEALQDACKVLEESQKHPAGVVETSNGVQGYYEVQGMHIIDIITLAIRAAKNYYTAHTNPQKLYAIRSEKLTRSDLYKVLDILKSMATRSFRGGLQLQELTEIIIWIESVDKMLKQEELQEQQEAAERESWVWREGDWTEKEREREWLFLKSFDTSHDPLPQWPEAREGQTLPNEFLLTLQDGQRLIKLHNALVAKSRRKFGQIKTWHTDVEKPYRMSENLSYWLKAAELRWEIKLAAPISDVVNNKNTEAWQALDAAVFRWSQGVREELMEEWRQEAQAQEKRRPPEVKIEVPDTTAETDSQTETSSTEALGVNVTHEVPKTEEPQIIEVPAKAKEPQTTEEVLQRECADATAVPPEPSDMERSHSHNTAASQSEPTKDEIAHPTKAEEPTVTESEVSVATTAEPHQTTASPDSSDPQGQTGQAEDKSLPCANLTLLVPENEPTNNESAHAAS